MLGMFKTLYAADSPLSSINLDKEAKEVSFIQRKSARFSAYGILMALIKCVIAGKGSFLDISNKLHAFGQKAAAG